MESELSGIFKVNLVVKNMVVGSPVTQFMHMRVKASIRFTVVFFFQTVILFVTSRNLCVLAWYKQNPCIMYDHKGKSLLYDSLNGLMNCSARSWYWSKIFYALQYGINTKCIRFNVTIIKININYIVYNFSICLNPLSGQSHKNGQTHSSNSSAIAD